MKVALITEGPSEHRIVKHIITRYFKGEDVEIRQIQPKLISGRQDNNTPGGWNEVLKYCGREEIRDILIENDYLVIQIDTDQSQISPFDVSHTHLNNTQKSPSELCTEVIEKLKGLFKTDIKHEYGHRIFFAICVHTIECWLLPIYYSNKETHCSKTVSCISLLNKELSRQNIQTLPTNDKNSTNAVRVYDTILQNWRKRTDIEESARYHAGFQIFIDSLGSIQSAKQEPTESRS
ncbi:hypothetical protein KK062_21565 [Fulvivirgaceae bacterium PWU5]|uniref:Uncharacterized protein n=1 Tax=Dawidia cretensis TaxID=2782350 RepID=A0AAP2E153_9BACT|nr:hypothetical protein [Dawidia cretensis]MBT1710845.1 hypothetical protein [Dawidia cretensis]